MPCPVWILQVVPCFLTLMHWTGGCTSLAIYILRGLSVSSCLWLWKQLYLNTACKLVFQNKRIIKMRGKRGRENVKYSCTSKKIESSLMSCGYRIFREQNMTWQFSELLCAQVPPWELGLAAVMAFRNRQMIAGKNREKEQEGRKMSARMLCYLPKHSLERACTLCVMLSFGEGKRGNYFGEDEPFSFLIFLWVLFWKISVIKARKYVRKRLFFCFPYRSSKMFQPI